LYRGHMPAHVQLQLGREQEWQVIYHPTVERSDA